LRLAIVFQLNIDLRLAAPYLKRVSVRLLKSLRSPASHRR